jgi:hypothetical protein
MAGRRARAAQGHPAELRGAGRHDLEPLGERGGLGAAVGLEPSDDHVGAVAADEARRLEHRVRLADAGSGPEEDLQAATSLALFLAPGALEERLGVRPSLAHGHGPPGRRERSARLSIDGTVHAST